jgi:hypothetical protein
MEPPRYFTAREDKVKILNSKFIKAAVCGSLLLSSLAFAGSNPSLAKLKIYGVAAATNADCSNAKVIGYNYGGTTFDLLTNPALVAGVVSPGTYNCLILIMDAKLNFTPAAGASGSCTAGTNYDRVLCRVGCNYTAWSIDANNIIQYGSSTGSTAASSSDLANSPKSLLFLSTSSTGNGSNAFLRPSIGNWTNGLPLNGAFTVTAKGTTGTFVVNFDGQVDGSGGTCDLLQPSFGFR